MKNQSFTASAVISLLAVALGLNSVVLSARAASAQPPAKSSGATLSAQGLQSFRALENVPYFAVGGVGFAGTTSEGEVALRVLLKEKNGPVVLRALFKTAKPAGKLYALLGLKQTGTVREVAEVASTLRPYKGLVSIRRGCLSTGESLGTLATQIEKGEIVLPKERAKPPAK